ncbi:MAG: T9SS type A sorting domain-containing protein [Williamsia sp.]|nr:T9SS type A sorting domain-containing protein [Williamsia sp.]
MIQSYSYYLKGMTTIGMLLFTTVKTCAQWIELGGTNHSPFNGIVVSIATDVSGNVYAGGIFGDSNNHCYVGKWNGMVWSELGGTSGTPFTNGYIKSIATDAAGNVYAGGTFTDANGNPYVAKWNSTAWSELGGVNGSPFTNKYHNNAIYCIATDAGGNVYAGGGVQDANSNYYIAKWNGTAWSKLGGTNDTTISNSLIYSIATDAGGNVYASGVQDANHNQYVAKWNGIAWSELVGVNGSPFNKRVIETIATDRGGNVYAGGMFTDANNNPYVAKWNGTAWNKLGRADDSTFSYGFSGNTIYSITTDASGNVYAGGIFTDANIHYYVAKWNGTAWSELGGAPFRGYIQSIATDAAGNVYAGGNFYDANINTYVAKYTQGNTSILPSHPSSENANFESTDSSGWTNYYSGSTLLLSLHKKGQNIGTLGDGTFAVKLVATAGAGSNTGIQLTNPLIQNSSGYWVMNRYWQVTTTTEPTANVGVRFYYNKQDLADVNGSYPNHNLTNQQFIFYKETGGNPDPTTNLAGATSLISIMPSTYASNTTWTFHQLTDSTQYAEFSVSGFSGGGGGGTGNGQALPVKILSFTATKQGTENLLQWTTGQETNSNYFGIERSRDGANFIPIGQVSAAGNSTTAKSYSLIDTKPINGTNYYRVKMVDKDGSFTYSSVRTINEAIHFSARIYPNPVQNSLNLNFNSDKAKTVQVQIVNYEGKIMTTQQIEVAAGTSTKNINITSLSNGEYYVRLVSKEGYTKLKFVKE